jgi:hypothetical protein
VSGELVAAGLLGDALVIEGVTEADCVEIAVCDLGRPPKGLSLADRARLALAARSDYRHSRRTGSGPRRTQKPTFGSSADLTSQGGQVDSGGFRLLLLRRDCISLI